MDSSQIDDIKRTRPTVRLSSATQTDASAMARLFLVAFHADNYRQALTPTRVGLSVAEVLSRDGILEERRVRRGLVGNDIYIKASVRAADNTGTETDTIVGWAKWSAPAGFRRRSIWDWLWSEILYPVHQFLFRPTVSAGLPEEATELFASQHMDTFGPGGVAEGRKVWYLHLLSVDPAWQGVGIGGALLKWGMERAREMDAVVYLESTTVGLPIYLAKGFRITSERPTKINDVCIKIPSMIWEPRLPVVIRTKN